jgi:hypothetical protein
MKKVVRIGSLKGYGDVFCEIKFVEGKLSISGVIGPLKNGDCRGGCGQICMEFEHRNPADNDDRYQQRIKPTEFMFAPGWDAEKWFYFLEVWKHWHLNDMRSGCEHQRGWGKKKLELITFKWTTSFYKMRESAASGTLESDQYEKFKEVAADAMIATTAIARPKWKSPLIEKLLSEGWIEEDKRETKTSGWVNETEHPEGELSKPCPVCGYKYGTSWLKEEVPAQVIEFLQALPPADTTPAWV